MCVCRLARNHHSCTKKELLAFQQVSEMNASNQSLKNTILWQISLCYMLHRANVCNSTKSNQKDGSFELASKRDYELTKSFFYVPLL